MRAGDDDVGAADDLLEVGRGPKLEPVVLRPSSSTKRSSVSLLRLQTRTSSQGKTSLQVASAPRPTVPAPTIASTLESSRASHFAETAAEEPVRIIV